MAAFDAADPGLVRWPVDLAGGGEPIRVRLDGTHASEIVLSVGNAGTIPPEVLPHIFDPFYRGADAIDRQIHGNGLGLSLDAAGTSTVQVRWGLDELPPLLSELGVGIEEESAPLGHRERRRDVDGGRGFAHATLLVRNRYDMGHIERLASILLGRNKLLANGLTLWWRSRSFHRMIHTNIGFCAQCAISCASIVGFHVKPDRTEPQRNSKQPADVSLTRMTHDGPIPCGT